MLRIRSKQQLLGIDQKGKEITDRDSFRLASGKKLAQLILVLQRERELLGIDQIGRAHV